MKFGEKRLIVIVALLILIILLIIFYPKIRIFKAPGEVDGGGGGGGIPSITFITPTPANNAVLATDSVTISSQVAGFVVDKFTLKFDNIDYALPDLLNCNFESSNNYACDQGEAGTSVGTTFAPGIISGFEGVLIDNTDTLTYTRLDNFNNAEGTIMFWFKPETIWADTNQPIHQYYLFDNRHPSTNQGVYIWRDGNVIKFGINTYAGNYENTNMLSSLINNFNWNLVVLSYSSGQMELVIYDAFGKRFSPYYTLSYTGNIQSPNSYLFIGSDKLGTTQAKGTFDEFKIYSKKLTRTEIDDLTDDLTDDLDPRSPWMFGSYYASFNGIPVGAAYSFTATAQDSLFNTITSETRTFTTTSMIFDGIDLTRTTIPPTLKKYTFSGRWNSAYLAKLLIATDPTFAGCDYNGGCYCQSIESTSDISCELIYAIEPVSIPFWYGKACDINGYCSNTIKGRLSPSELIPPSITVNSPTSTVDSLTFRVDLTVSALTQGSLLDSCYYNISQANLVIVGKTQITGCDTSNIYATVPAAGSYRISFFVNDTFEVENSAVFKDFTVTTTQPPGSGGGSGGGGTGGTGGGGGGTGGGTGTAQKVNLSINSNPSGASLYINGVFKGNTPLLITNLDQGTYQLTLKKDGYQDKTQSLTITSADKGVKTVTIEFSPLPKTENPVAFDKHDASKEFGNVTTILLLFVLIVAVASYFYLKRSTKK